MNLMQHMAKKGYQGLGLISAIPWTWPIAESRCLRSGQKIQLYLLPSSLISIGYFPCVLASQCSRKGERSCSEQLAALREFMANKQPWAGKEETIPLFHHSFSHPSQAFRVGSLRRQLPRTKALAVREESSQYVCTAILILHILLMFLKPIFYLFNSASGRVHQCSVWVSI